MVTILRKANETPVPDIAKEARDQRPKPIYGWRKHFGTLEPADIKHLRRLEQENGRLKRLMADRDLVVSARVRRQQVAYAEGRGLSRHCACA